MRRQMTAMKLHFTLQSVRRRKYMLIYLQCLKEARKHYNENFIERERVTWPFPREQHEFDDYINGTVQNPEYWKKTFG